MNEVTRFLQLEGGRQDLPDLWAVLLALTVALACSLLIGVVYRATTNTPGYSQSYVQTLIITSLVTALIMVVIGSNLARAFSLIGALSIVRFRNAVKETRDVGFIFFALAVAMAAGTRFYSIAILATFYICGTSLCLHYFSYGRREVDPERILRVRLPVDVEPLEFLEPVLSKYFTHFSLAQVETTKQGMYLDAVLAVRQKPKSKSSEIIKELSELNNNLKIVYHIDKHLQDP